MAPGELDQLLQRPVHQPGIGRMGDRLGLHGGVHRHPLQVLGLASAPVLCTDRQALLDQGHELVLAQALAPAGQRRAVERQLVAERQLAAEVLVIRVLQPARAQRLVTEAVHVLQDEQPGHQPGRQARLAGAGRAHRAEPAVQKVPVDPIPQQHQRMLQIDDLIQRRLQQVLLALVPRSSHRALPISRTHDQGITNHRKSESQIARNPPPTRGFPANSITSKRRLSRLPQRLQHSSQATNYPALAASLPKAEPDYPNARASNAYGLGPGE